MKMNEIKVKSSGKVKPKKGINLRVPYEHQKSAFECLDIINQQESFRAILKSLGRWSISTKWR